MGTLQLKATMEGIAQGLMDGKVVTKAWAYPFEAASPGDAVVGYPDFKLGSGAFRRVLDSATFPVLIVAGVAQEAATQDVLDRLIGDGTRGPITTKIQQIFFDAVAGKSDKYRHWLTVV